jgi:hypothetical protein
MVDDTVEAGGSPCPRGQNVLFKALGEDAPAAQHRVAVKPSRHDDEPNRLARNGQIRQSPLRPAVDPLRSRSAARTGAYRANWANGDQRQRAIAGGVLDHKAAMNKPGRSEGLGHRIDALCETNPSRPPNFIKSESEPNFKAESRPCEDGVGLAAGCKKRRLSWIMRAAQQKVSPTRPRSLLIRALSISDGADSRRGQARLDDCPNL